MRNEFPSGEAARLELPKSLALAWGEFGRLSGSRIKQIDGQGALWDRPEGIVVAVFGYLEGAGADGIEDLAFGAAGRGWGTVSASFSDGTLKRYGIRAERVQ